MSDAATLAASLDLAAAGGATPAFSPLYQQIKGLSVKRAYQPPPALPIDLALALKKRGFLLE